MSCVTPSHPKPIPPCESLNVEQVQERTGSTLWVDGRLMEEPSEEEARKVGATCWVYTARLLAISCKKCVVTESTGYQFVCRGQVKYLAQQESGVKFVGDVGRGSGGRSHTRGRLGCGRCAARAGRARERMGGCFTG